MVRESEKKKENGHHQYSIDLCGEWNKLAHQVLASFNMVHGD